MTKLGITKVILEAISWRSVTRAMIMMLMVVL